MTRLIKLSSIILLAFVLSMLIDKITILKNPTCTIPLEAIKEFHRLLPQNTNVKTPMIVGIKNTNNDNGTFQEELFISDEQMNCATVKSIYSFEIPGPNGFLTPDAIKIQDNYIIATYFFGNSHDILITDLTGKLIASSIIKGSKFETGGWSVARDDISKITLQNISGKEASAKLDLATGLLE